MKDDLHFPLPATLGGTAAFFLVSLLVLDLLLVRWLKLGKVAWKWVDYIWLSLAVIGVLAAVSESRMVVARSYAATLESRLNGTFSRMRWQLDAYSRQPGSVCRTFTRSEYSPPAAEFERIEREFHLACEWFKSIAGIVSHTTPSPATKIDSATWPEKLDLSLPDLKHLVDELFRMLDRYNGQVDTLRAMQEQTRRADWEDIFVVLAPFMLAFALALRITKVTGEIKLES